METYQYKDVVVIGNGPSGITASYMLAGYWPFYNEQDHPLEFLQHRLEDNKKTSLIEQDLMYLSNGLEGRSTNPVSVLFDTLAHPAADLGCDNPSVLCWRKDASYKIDHVVLGKGIPGGSWQKMDGKSLTISLGSWMELPTMKLNPVQPGLRQKRAMIKSVAQYYHQFVESQNLAEYFVDNAVVTSVSKVIDPVILSGSICTNTAHLWKVSGQLEHCTKVSDFTYVTQNVVLATGNSDQPNRLNVDGETLPFVLHSLSELEKVISSGMLKSGNLMVVGAGLSAADAIITARFHNIPVVHVFRRSVHDSQLIFNKLPQNVYPEYHKVHTMMLDFNQECYKGYKAYPMYKVNSIGSNHIVSISPCIGEKPTHLICASYVLILIGMHPDLSMLPENGTNMGIYPSHPIDCKNNPIAIHLYSHESIYEPGLYAVGPLVGDNFVRFVQGGCLAAVSHIWKHKSSA